MNKKCSLNKQLAVYSKTNCDYRKIYSDNMGGLKWNPNKFEVHHIDINHNNNEFSNLVLLPTKLHRQFHSAFTEVSMTKDFYDEVLSYNPENYNDYCIFKDDIDNFLNLKLEVSYFWTLKNEYLKKSRPLGFDPENHNFEYFVKAFSMDMYNQYCR